MDQLEKVEKLRERANVSYDEAKKALEENNWDLLEAMVALEKEGKVPEPDTSSYTTSYEEQTEYISVPATVYEQQQRQKEGTWDKFKKFVKKSWQMSKDNYFRVVRHGEEMFRMPVWALILILLCGWHCVVPVMIIAFFFDCHYQFVGKNDLSKVNEAMEKGNDLADKIKNEYNK